MVHGAAVVAGEQLLFKVLVLDAVDVRTVCPHKELVALDGQGHRGHAPFQLDRSAKATGTIAHPLSAWVGDI